MRIGWIRWPVGGAGCGLDGFIGKYEMQDTDWIDSMASRRCRIRIDWMHWQVGGAGYRLDGFDGKQDVQGYGLDGFIGK